MEVLERPDHWDPVTAIDWIAVWSYSLAFAFLAVAVPLLARDARPGRPAVIAAFLVSVAAALAAVGNVVEDAFGVGGASTVYVIGALGTMIGLLTFAVALFATRRRDDGLVAVLFLAGIAMQVTGLGFLVLVGAVLAARNHLARRAQLGVAAV